MEYSTSIFTLCFFFFSFIYIRTNVSSSCNFAIILYTLDLLKVKKKQNVQSNKKKQRFKYKQTKRKKKRKKKIFSKRKQLAVFLSFYNFTLKCLGNALNVIPNTRTYIFITHIILKIFNMKINFVEDFCYIDVLVSGLHR